MRENKRHYIKSRIKKVLCTERKKERKRGRPLLLVEIEQQMAMKCTDRDSFPFKNISFLF